MKNFRTIYKGRIFKLIKIKKRLPHGRISEFAIIKHPGAVVIAPLLNKYSIVMLKQYRFAVNKYIYELPAGTLKKREKKAFCAKRELEEETGYVAKNISFLGYIYSAPGYSTETLYIFKATNLVKGNLNLDADEIIKTAVLTKKQVAALFKSGKIVDAKTIAALAFVGWL